MNTHVAHALLQPLGRFDLEGLPHCRGADRHDQSAGAGTLKHALNRRDSSRRVERTVDTLSGGKSPDLVHDTAFVGIDDIRGAHVPCDGEFGVNHVDGDNLCHGRQPGSNDSSHTHSSGTEDGDRGAEHRLEHIQHGAGARLNTTAKGARDFKRKSLVHTDRRPTSDHRFRRER